MLTRVTTASILILAMALCAAPSRSYALSACAGKPDGKEFLVGGEQGGVWVLETANWTVTKQLDVKGHVLDLGYSHDGGLAVVVEFQSRGDSRQAHVFNTKDWSEVAAAFPATAMALAGKAPVAVTCQGLDLTVWSLPDWKKVKTVTAPAASYTFQTVVVTPDGKTAYVRTTAFADEQEKKVDAGPKPQLGALYNIWQAKNDGRVSKILTVDLEAGKIVAETNCFTTPSTESGIAGRTFVTDTSVIAVQYNGFLDVMDRKTGELEIVVLGNGKSTLAYGVGLASNGELYIGSVGYAAFGLDGKKITKSYYIAKPQDAHVEYMLRFAPAGADKIAMVSEVGRIFVIDTKTHEIVRTIDLPGGEKKGSRTSATTASAPAGKAGGK